LYAKVLFQILALWLFVSFFGAAMVAPEDYGGRRFGEH
jgi:hypothetical protein